MRESSETAAPEAQYGVTIEKRSRAVITGVTEVEAFDEGSVALKTLGGHLVLTGSGLHVSSLALEEGRLLLEGTIDALSWEGAEGGRRGGFLRRAFR